LPAPTPALTVDIVEGLRVLALRYLAGGVAAIDVVLAGHGLALMTRPGGCKGADPWLAWISPTESLLLTSRHAVADGVLRELAPGRAALACALDQSGGCLVFELLGAHVGNVLPRLLDVSAIPQRAGQGSRARLMDISVLVIRLEPDRVLLVVDRMHGLYAAQWLRHALDSLD
jgi:sarcosine oxidase gamma subunit